MEKQIAEVKEFNKKYHVPINVPRIGMPDCGPLRYKMQIEEAMELKDAIEKNNITDIADALIDTIYVALGTAIVYGIEDKMSQMFDVVHRANMTKSHNLDENGKITKGPLFVPPESTLRHILGVAE